MMIEKVNEYFIDKKINAYVSDCGKNNNFVVMDIDLVDITKLNKFNATMQKELQVILKANISLEIGDNIRFIINTMSRDIKDSDIMKIFLGTKVDGSDMYISFKNNPHWLLAGATGSGKSVFLNNVITQLLLRHRNRVQLSFIDFKKVEFYKYNKLSIKTTEVANDIEHAKFILTGLVNLMNERYIKYQQNNCLNIEDFNAKFGANADRYQICIIDEMAELILCDSSVLEPIQRILQLGRASGIFLICATQRPSADILPGTLKVNFTTRICFKVGNMYDSKTILNEKGAERLSGNGDCLILKNGAFNLERFQALKPIENTHLINLS